MSNRRKRHLTLSVVIMVGVGWACPVAAEFASPANSAEPYVPLERLSGRLAIAGSETMQPLLVRLSAEFRRRYPDVKIGIEGGGSAPALTNFLEGSAFLRRGDGSVAGHEGANQVSVMASSRELSPKETDRFIARHGYPPMAIPIAVDAVAIYVHQQNPLTGLTLQAVDAIFSRTLSRGYGHKIQRWGQLGLEGEWEDSRIRLYGRDRNSGTRLFFQEAALLGGEFSVEVTEMPGTASIVLAVSRDPFSIGYGGIGFLISSVRALAIADKPGAPFVVPSAATASDGTYPLRRLLYVYVNKAAGRPLQPVVREFLAFINSRDGQEAVSKMGFYPLTADDVARNKRLLNPAESMLKQAEPTRSR